MKDKILSTIFLDVYNNSEMFDNKKTKILVEDYPSLEKTLENYLIDVIGYRIIHNYEENFREIRKYFENIIYNSKNKNYKNIIECINSYRNEFQQKLESHYYVNLFIETIKRIYSKSYDGKISLEENRDLTCSSIAISDKGNSFILGRTPRKDEQQLPLIHINDIDKFEKILKQYVESVAMSDSFYNLFNNEGFINASFESKIKILFECTMLNATNSDLNCIENFFRKYNDFINNKTFENIRSPKFLGNAFDDELFVMLKRSELEYETPYYLAFMLKNKKVELPNIRLGIEEKENKLVAHIIATQSAQKILDKENLSKVQSDIKENLPNDPYFRFYNPTHLISLLMTFGILNGIGIKHIGVKDFLPFRYNKTVLDKQMNEEEAYNYQTRLTNKNLITYMRLIELVEGIDIISYPEMDMGLNLYLQDEIKCKNKFLQHIYDISYDLGRKYNINLENGNQNKTI